MLPYVEGNLITEIQIRKKNQNQEKQIIEAFG